MQPVQNVFSDFGMHRVQINNELTPNVTELATYHRLLPGFRLHLGRLTLWQL